MTSEEIGVFGYLRRLYLVSALTAGLAMVSGPAGVAQTVVDPDAIAGNAQAVSQLSPFDTTVAYVVQFYPLWFTYYQTQLAGHGANHLIGPNRISPVYHYVVAINVDTLYVSTFLDLTAGPVIVTIPATPPFQSYSILMLDPYGDLLPASIPRCAGKLCPDRTGRIFRHASKRGHSHHVACQLFGFDLQGRQILPNWREPDRTSRRVPQVTQLDPASPRGGAAKIVPEILFSVPFKTTADDLITHDPIAFLRQLQRAVASDHTPTLSPYEQALSDRFDSLFANRNVNRSEFSAGAQAAHELILDRYLTHTDWAALSRQTGSISPISVTGAIRSSNDRRSPNSSSTPTA